VAVGPIFRSVVTPGCPVAPSTSWPAPMGRMKIAEAIVPPGPPTGLAGTVNGSTVVLTWTAPTSGGAPTSYVIQAGYSPGLSNLANFSTGSAATSFTANNVASGVYYVRVLAANAGGTSGASNEISLFVSACSGPPSAPSGLASLVSGSTVTLSWTAATGSPTNYLIDV